MEVGLEVASTSVCSSICSPVCSPVCVSVCYSDGTSDVVDMSVFSWPVIAKGETPGVCDSKYTYSCIHFEKQGKIPLYY